MADSSPTHFARLPYSVLTDNKISNTAKILYCFMAGTLRGGNIITIGSRKLAEISGLDRRTVRRCLEELGSQGHVSRAIGRFSRRSVFQLNSPVFLADAETKEVPRLLAIPKKQHM